MRKATISVAYTCRSAHFAGAPRAVFAAAKHVGAPCMAHPSWSGVVSVRHDYGPAVEQRLSVMRYQLIAEIPGAA